jgi:hypothetical protein
MELPSVCTQSNNIAVRLHKETEVKFLMPLIYSQIKSAIKTEAMFSILGIRGRQLTGLCSFRMTLLYSLKMEYKARGNGLQVA